MKSLTHFHHIILLLSDGLSHDTLEFLTGDRTTGRPPMSCYSQRIGDMGKMGIEFECNTGVVPGCCQCRYDYRMLTPSSRAWKILDRNGRISDEAKEVLRERYHVWIHKQSIGEVIERQMQFSFSGGV